MSSDGKTLRLGMIGAGFIAQVAHLHAFARVENVRIAAIAEAHDGLRETVAERHGIPRAVADYRDLLDDSDIDAVVVSMPRRAQAGVVTDAITAKRAVLSEKPMAMTVAEADAMLSSARRCGTKWAVGYMKRHDRGVQLFADLMRELVERREWGAILDVEMRDFCATYGMAIPHHVRRKGPRPVRYPESAAVPDFVAPECARAYEYTVNVASHDINLLRLFFGTGLKPKSLDARDGGAQRAVFDAGSFSVALTFGPADIGRWDQAMNVTFEKGRASLLLPSPMARQESASIELTHKGRTEHIRVPHTEHVWAFEAQARSFAESALTGKEPLTSGEDSIADLALVESLWRNVDWHQ